MGRKAPDPTDKHVEKLVEKYATDRGLEYLQELVAEHKRSRAASRS